MPNETSLLTELIDAFRCLPGVGLKTAQRMALHILERDREGGEALSLALDRAVREIGHCKRCNNFTETDLCTICSSVKRDLSILCVVESPADVLALESAGGYGGYYFVLMGRLSPLDGIGPKEIHIDRLVQLVRSSSETESPIKEIILATNPTVEGEATASYIADVMKDLNVMTSRIAHGVPVGGELEYIDSGTLAHALANRKNI